MRSVKSTIVTMTLFTAVACFAVALLAPVNAAPEPSIVVAEQGPSFDAPALAPDAVAGRLASGAAPRSEFQKPLVLIADADRSLRRIAAIESVASAVRVPRPGPGALLVAGLIGVGAIAWRRAATRPNRRLDASTVL